MSNKKRLTVTELDLITDRIYEEIKKMQPNFEQREQEVLKDEKTAELYGSFQNLLRIKKEREDSLKNMNNTIDMFINEEIIPLFGPDVVNRYGGNYHTNFFQNIVNKINPTKEINKNAIKTDVMLSQHDDNLNEMIKTIIDKYKK